jgi:hypothetical protein
MSARTYLPQLVKTLNYVCKYVAKYQSTINHYLTTEQQTLLTALTSACVAFTDAYIAPDVLP